MNKLAYLELDEKPDNIISHEDFEYYITGFTTKHDFIAEGKLLQLMRYDKSPVCVKYEGKYYIYVKIRDSVQVPENEVPEPPVEGCAVNGVDDSKEQK